MRVKRGVAAHKRHKKVLAQTKGMGHSRQASYRLANQAALKALSYGYRDRRNKKRDLRSLWVTRINAAANELGTSYSQLMGQLKKANVTIDRKILAELAATQPKAFKAVADTAAKAK